jgi:hypothetical protein
MRCYIPYDHRNDFFSVCWGGVLVWRASVPLLYKRYKVTVSVCLVGQSFFIWTGLFGSRFSVYRSYAMLQIMDNLFYIIIIVFTLYFRSSSFALSDPSWSFNDELGYSSYTKSLRSTCNFKCRLVHAYFIFWRLFDNNNTIFSPTDRKLKRCA